MYSVAGTPVKVYSEEEKQSGAHAGRWTWTSAPGRNALVMFLPGHTAACRAQNCNLESFSLTTLSSISLLLVRQHAGEVNVSLFAVDLCCRDAAKAVVDNLCLRQQLLVLQRRQPRPRLEDADRRFWVLACRSFVGWRASLLVVKPETVLRWHRNGWRAYLAPAFMSQRPPEGRRIVI